MQLSQENLILTFFMLMNLQEVVTHGFWKMNLEWKVSAHVSSKQPNSCKPSMLDKLEGILSHGF
jgi:hypothetical protein